MTDLPLHLVQDDDPRMFLPLVSVEVDGTPVRAVLDTGAGTSQLVDHPGLVVEPRTGQPAHGAFGHPITSLGVATVTYRLGGTEVGPVRVDVAPRGLPRPADLLGLDVLARFRCLYRLTDAALTLDPGATQTPEATHPIRVGRHGHVHLEASWTDGTDRVDGTDPVDGLAVADGLFDTGAAVTVVDQGFVDRHPGLFATIGRQTGTDASGRSVETTLATMTGPRVLGRQLDDALVAVVDLGPLDDAGGRRTDLVLGWSLLHQADWYVDHPGHRAACLPRPRPGARA